MLLSGDLSPRAGLEAVIDDCWIFTVDARGR
jgi:hypothetical protein